MKKYALLLSGQPRYREAALKSILNNVININDVDIFGFFWKYNNFKPDYPAISDTANYRDQLDYDSFDKQLESILTQIPFTSVTVSEQIPFNPERHHPGEEKERVIQEIGIDKANKHFKRCNFIMQSQWYGVYMANQLRKEYEKENGKKYEGVLKFRPDVLTSNPIHFQNYVTDKLNLPHYNEGVITNDTTLICTDIIAYGSSDIMNIFCDFYNHHDRILKYPGIDALLGNPLAMYIKETIKNENVVANHFNFRNQIVHNIIRTL